MSIGISTDPFSLPSLDELADPTEADLLAIEAEEDYEPDMLAEEHYYSDPLAYSVYDDTIYDYDYDED